MKILDLYIIKKFLGTFIFIIVLLMSIAVIFDVSEKIDDFLDSKASVTGIIFHYYKNFIIHYGNLFSAFIIFISVIWFTSKLASNTEIVAILSSGVSFNRLLWPYFIGATILASSSLYLNHFVLPHANRQKLNFEEQFIFTPLHFRQKNYHREISPGVIASFHSFNIFKNEAHLFSVEKWDDLELKEKIFSEKAIWDSVKSTWTLKNFFIRKFENNKEFLEQGGTKDTSFYTFNPADFSVRSELASTMDYFELNAYIDREIASGSNNIPQLMIEKHQRTSYPFATYILTLIGVSVASRKLRGGLGLHLALGIVLVMVYIFFMKISTVAATNAGLMPLLAVWLPNLLFLLIAFWIYRKAPK